VDLYHACHVVGSLVRLPGMSDCHLIDRIQAVPGFAGGSKRLMPAAGLEGGVTLRPIAALHWLSYATRPRYQDDLLDRYLHWALARYIGLFEHVGDGWPLPVLRLSEAGQRIKGNQRRVTSEEMGVGFGALLASHWLRQTGASSLPASIVDVDAALDDRYIYAGGSRQAVRAIKGRRPDYLLVVPDPSSRRMYRVRALECKGTCSGISYGIRQMASASQQLTGITVGGRVPKGLAVSTVTGNDRLSYLAIDPDEADDPSYPVNSNTIDQAAGFQLGDNLTNVPPGLLTNASVRAGWATLADFSGNLPALDRWAPSVMRRRLERQPRQRTTLDTPYGPARGTSVAVDIDGQRLRITYAAEVSVDQQLTGPAEGIADAQRVFAERLAQYAEDELIPQGLQIDGSLYSATSDGSIFSASVQ
jgi:hypothetical protein